MVPSYLLRWSKVVQFTKEFNFAMNKHGQLLIKLIQKNIMHYNYICPLGEMV